MTATIPTAERGVREGTLGRSLAVVRILLGVRGSRWPPHVIPEGALCVKQRLLEEGARSALCR